MRSSPVTIAIDGPSGSGKSSVSRAVARELSLDYLDTGAMYRALTWWCLQRGIDLGDPGAVATASTRLTLEIGTDPERPGIAVEGTDVAQAIRDPLISAHVSKIATNLAVRADMRDRQRRLIAASRELGHGIVVEGRDITTVVAPEAEHRILLSASEEARLARRSQELHDSSVAQSADAVRDQVLRRDRDDATVSAFFEPAEGVVGIDTSHLTFTQSVAAVLSLVRGAPTTQDHPTPITEGLS